MESNLDFSERIKKYKLSNYFSKFLSRLQVDANCWDLISLWWGQNVCWESKTLQYTSFNSFRLGKMEFEGPNRILKFHGLSNLTFLKTIFPPLLSKNKFCPLKKCSERLLSGVLSLNLLITNQNMMFSTNIWSWLLQKWLISWHYFSKNFSIAAVQTASRYNQLWRGKNFKRRREKTALS